ncbi:unnamed protein product [Rotaria sp. Silwood1]|nr:unnamed protein product [Rotaria sp. Silwood1]
MPELPEVEYARRLLARFLNHTHITKVTYPDADGLSRRFMNCTPTTFANSLVNRKILDIKRHGKYLWFEMMDQQPLTPIFHFGMSGGFRIKSAPDVTYSKEIKLVKMKAKNEIDGQCESFVYDDELDADLTWPPRFTRMRFLTSKGHDICYTDLRKFGRFHLVESKSPRSCLPLSKLGFDPYLEMPTYEDFINLIHSYRSASIELKGLLLDQTFCAGIGNWIADEILYQSQFHPRKRLNTLNDEQLKILHKNIDYVIRTAVDAGGSHKFPPEWLFHYRWTNKRTTEDYYKLTIKFDTVGGRTSAYVPQRQILSNDEQQQVDVRLAAREVKRNSKKKMKINDENDNESNDDENNETSIIVADAKVPTKKRSKRKMIKIDTETNELPSKKKLLLAPTVISNRPQRAYLIPSLSLKLTKIMVQTSPTPFDVGRAFVHQYYTLLHQAPHMLHRFYSTDSTFIHGGVDRPGCVEQPAVGPESISQRINDLNLRDCHAKIRQVDSHPTIGDGVVVQVTGELSNNGDPMRRFMQTFVLAPRQPKKYYVQNDIFRYQDEVFDDGSDEVDEDDRSSSHIYGDTISNADKVSNADSSAAMAATSQQPLLVTATVRSSMEEQQPLPPRSNVSTLPNNQPQIIPIQTVRQQEHQHTGSTNLNGFANANVNESTNYSGLNHTHLQQQEIVQSHSQSSPRPLNHQENQQQINGGNVPNQQPVKQTTTIQQPTLTEGQRPEGTSYAGIAKLHSSTGSTSNVTSTSTTTSRNGSISNTIPTSISQQSNTIRSSVKPPLTTTNRPSSNPQLGQQQQQQPQRGSGNYHSQTNRGINVATAPNEQQVFVGSLPLNITKETLIECFSKFGKVLDAKIHTPAHDNKKNFGFVVFDDPEVAISVVKREHVMYDETTRLNVEPKTQRNYPLNNNIGGNFNNGPQGGGGGGRNSNYQGRGSGRGGNRAPYRGGGNNQRRGGQFNNNSPSFSGADENNNEYRSSKPQQSVQQ